MSRNVSHEAPALVNLKHETLQLLRYPSLTIISKMPKVNQSEINLDPLDASWCKSLDREEELLPLGAKALRIAVPWPANATQDTQESTVFMVSNARKCGSVPFSDFFEIDWSFEKGLQICVNCRSRHLYSLMSSCNQTQEQLAGLLQSNIHQKNWLALPILILTSLWHEASLPLRLKVCIRKALQQVTPQNQKRNRVVKHCKTTSNFQLKEMERAKKGHPTAAPALMEPSISALRGLQGPPAPLEVSAVPSSCG